MTDPEPVVLDAGSYPSSARRQFIIAVVDAISALSQQINARRIALYLTGTKLPLKFLACKVVCEAWPKAGLFSFPRGFEVFHA